MDTSSVLNAQTIIPSSQPDNVQTAEEIAAEEAEQQELDFLNLLLTQLENQNPLDPMDTDEWTAQLTRYSQLEQQIETNEKLAVQNALLEESASSSVFSYIGQDAELATNISAVQNGEAEWSYLVEGQASEITLTVTDADGNTVYEADGNISSGAHNFTLDTSQAALEQSVAEGAELYLFVNAADSKGNSLNTQTTSHVTIDGIWTDNNQTYMTAGDISFRSADILKIVDTNQQNNTNDNQA